MQARRPTPSAEPLVALQAAQGGVFRRTQALALGWTSAQVETALRRREWLDCGGGYCLNDGPTAGVLERRRVAARRLRLKGEVWASHATAAVIFGFPFVDPPAQAVVSRHREGPSGHLHGVLTSRIPDHHRVVVGGTLVVASGRTLVDLARTAADKYDAQAVVDGALRIGVALADVEEALTYCARWPGIERARTAVAFAEPLCESPLESRVRWWLHDAGLPMPASQVAVRTAAGVFRVDFLYEDQKLVIEADGQVKYDSSAPWLTDDERRRWDGRKVLWAEKRREDALRAAGYRVVRVYWSDGADGGAAFARRVRHELGLAA